MKYQDQIIKKTLVCWIMAAVVFFCAIVPVSGWCDCEHCPAANSTCSDSTCSEKTVKSNSTPDCCRLISKTANSDDCGDNYCSCDCVQPPVASISLSNSLVLPDELKMLVFTVFFAHAETVGKSVLGINTQQSPIFWLPVRLHLFLFVLLN
ncbi:MAG: hypothetical protein LBE12_10465 [Planctomycetaceae bacterium]|nr:hypothetical protein [Planctomycetaceae bacterium]